MGGRLDGLPRRKSEHKLADLCNGYRSDDRSFAQPLELPPGWIDCPPFGKAPVVGGKKLNVIPSKVREQMQIMQHNTTGGPLGGTPAWEWPTGSVSSPDPRQGGEEEGGVGECPAFRQQLHGGVLEWAEQGMQGA